MIKMIVAVDNNNGIGLDNDLVIPSKADMKFFRETTTGNVVVMGRKTMDSIGRPLPNRTNIVVSRNKDYNVGDGGFFCADSVESVLEITDNIHGKDIYIIGGKSIYEMFMPIADVLLVTHHDTEVEHDTKFPSIDESHWRPVSTTPIAPCGDFKSNVVEYVRVD